MARFQNPMAKLHSKSSGCAVLTTDQMKAVFGKDFEKLVCHTTGYLMVFFSKREDGFWNLNVYDTRHRHAPAS